MSRLKARFQIAQRLSPGDWVTLAEAWWGLLYYYVAVRSVSFERLNQPGMADGTPAKAGGIEKARHLHELVRLASRLHLLSMTCLPRTLTLRRMLLRRDIAAVVRIGVRKEEKRYQAHAWVEAGGAQVGEPEDVTERFQRFGIGLGG